MNERAKLSGRSLRTLQSPVIRPKLHRGNSLDTSQTSSKRELSSEFTKWDWLDLSDRSMFYCSSNTSIFDSLSLELMSSGDEDEGEEDEDEDEDEEEGFQSRVGRRYGPLANQPIKSIRASSFYQSTTLPEFSKSFHRHTAKHQELRNNSGGSFRYRHRLANRLNDSSGAFTSSNVYIRPLPNSFSDQDLRALCFSVIRFRGDERTKFDILSVKVMVERSDDRFNGPCKGFGFCLWNSVEACARCIEGLRAEGYQASYARETSRGMLTSLADRSSANLYLSNLPRSWGEADLRALFGDTHIASARLLRDRDDEAVGTGTSRGVGFVRLETRATALHFVEVLHGMPIRGGANGGHLQCRLADSPAQKEWKRNFRFRGDENRDSGTDTSPNDVQSPEPVLKPSSNIKWPVKRENNKRHGHRPITFYPNSPAPSITSISLSQSVTRGPSTSSGRAFSANINDFDSSGQFVPGSELQPIIPIGPFIPIFPSHWYANHAGCFGLNNIIDTTISSAPLQHLSNCWHPGDESDNFSEVINYSNTSKTHAENSYESNLRGLGVLPQLQTITNDHISSKPDLKNTEKFKSSSADISQTI